MAQVEASMAEWGVGTPGWLVPKPERAPLPLPQEHSSGLPLSGVERALGTRQVLG